VLSCGADAPISAPARPG